MVAQDARWIGDALLSAGSSRNSGWLTLMLIGHAARIVYEGSKAMRSGDPAVGLPELAAELTDRYGSVVTRARHAGKFLDDTKKSFDKLSDEMADFYAAHQAEFLGNALGSCVGWSPT
jgi:hypothetical protein